MSQQTIKQQARKTARTVMERRRRERAERERRIEGLAVQVMVAIGERDAAVASAERRAGQALHDLTHVEKLTLAQAVEWCSATLSSREASRLRGLIEDAAGDDEDAAEDAAVDAAVDAEEKGEATGAADDAAGNAKESSSDAGSSSR